MNPTPQATAPEAPAIEPESQRPAPKPSSDPSVQNTEIATLLDLIVDDADRKMLIDQEVTRLTFNQNYRLAKMFSEAGYFDSNGYNTPPMTASQAMAKIEVGRSWGLNAADSIRFVYIINGKPAVEESMFARKLYQSGWSWIPQFIGGEGPGCKGVRLWIRKNGSPYMQEVRDDEGNLVRDEAGAVMFEQVSVSFTEEHASRIKVWQRKIKVSLLEKDGPWSDGWRANMYFWRTISQFRKFHAPDIMSGAMLRDEVTDIGELDVVPAGPSPKERESIGGKIDAVLGRKRKAKEDGDGEPLAKAADEPHEAAQAKEDFLRHLEKKEAELAKAAQAGTAAPTAPAADAPDTAPPSTPAPSAKAADAGDWKIDANYGKLFNRAEATIGTKRFEEILSAHGFKGVLDIKSEADATKVIAAARAAAAK